MILKVPQRSSCADLQNRESLDAVKDCTRLHVPIKGFVPLITRPTCLYAPSCALTRLHALADVIVDVIHVSPCLHRCWRHLLASAADVTCLHQPLTSSFDYGDLTVDFSRLIIDFDCWLFSRVDFFSLGSSYPIFRLDFIFAVFFCILCL